MRISNKDWGHPWNRETPDDEKARRLQGLAVQIWTGATVAFADDLFCLTQEPGKAYSFSTPEKCLAYLRQEALAKDDGS